MKYVIFDLDGCISDDRHRRDLLPTHDGAWNGDFDAYHDKLWKDNPINAETLQKMITMQRESSGLGIVFCTARPRKFEEKTRSWLAAHFGSFEYTLLMRANDDFRPSPELKVALIEGEKIPWKKVHAAFDDRNDVLEAYQDRGLLSVHLLTPPDVTIELPVQGSVPEILKDMAATYAERNKVYKDNWKDCTELMKVLFPEGVPPEIAHSHAFGLFYMIVGKVTRFAQSGLTHMDSVHDIAVYAAMIEHALREGER